MRKNHLNIWALTLFLCIGIAALVSFAINIRAMLILKLAFQNTNWIADFESITKFMLARVLLQNFEITDLTESDAYKFTLICIFTNNLIVLFLALAEIAIVTFSAKLRQVLKLPEVVVICFIMIALVTPFIFLLSKYAGGF